MVHVSKDKAAENRDALLRTAGRLFRQYGFDGVGVAQIAKEAGLTHGALYAHFSSKDELAAAALAYACAGNLADTRAWIGDRSLSFEELASGYASAEMRDRLETGCPMVASISEVGRKDASISASFTRGFEDLVAMFEASLGSSIPESRRRSLALASAAAEIGALAVSRAVKKTDAAMADELLKAVQAVLATAHDVELKLTA